jgi:uncharacterized NAD-dependent epimerase/dehydratase family protein
MLLEAIEAGLDIEAGLHTLLSDDEELRAAAEKRGVQLRDLRLAPPDLDVPRGARDRPTGVRVVHSVGSDTMIGKKVLTLELDRAARARRLRSVFVATGQTGIAIAGWGIAIDHVVSDYVAGRRAHWCARVRRGATCCSWRVRARCSTPPTPASRSVCSTARRRTCSSSPTRPERPRFGTTPMSRCCPLPELVQAYEEVARPVHPARGAALALNTSGLDEAAARAAIDEAEAACRLVADDVIRFGPERVLDAVLRALPSPLAP